MTPPTNGTAARPRSPLSPSAKKNPDNAKRALDCLREYPYIQFISKGDGHEQVFSEVGRQVRRELEHRGCLEYQPVPRNGDQQRGGIKPDLGHQGRRASRRRQGQRRERGGHDLRLLRRRLKPRGSGPSPLFVQETLLNLRTVARPW